jgi:hypothetical protein
MSDLGLSIIIGFCLICVIGGMAYWFAVTEQKTMKPGPVDLDKHTRQTKREAASRITNFPPN